MPILNMGIYGKSLMIAVIILMVAVLFVISLTYGLSRKKNVENELEIQDASRSIRIYKIDMKLMRSDFNSQKAVYFKDKFRLTRPQKLDPNKKETAVHYESFDNFLKHFKNPNVLHEWIESLLDRTENTPNFLEIEIVPYKRHKYARAGMMTALLEVEKINYKEEIIYLSSHVLKATDIKTKQSKSHEKFLEFQTNEGFSRAFRACNGKGMTVCFNFFHKRTDYEEIDQLAFLQIKKIFLKYHNSNRPIIAPLGAKKIIFSDFHVSSRPQLLNLTNQIKNDINSYLAIASKQDTIGFTLGVANNKNFISEPPEAIVNMVCELADAAKQDQLPIIWHEPGRDYKEDNESATFRTEVERIVSKKLLNYTFRPIVKIPTGEVLGYQSFATPKDTFFNSMDDLKLYAVRTEDDKELFSNITRTTIATFNAQVGESNAKLFYKLRYNERDYVSRTLAHISNIQNTHIVLVYSEQDLCDLPSSSEDAIVTQIRTLKTKGYEVALELNDNDLTLSYAIYDSFDFYLIDVNENLKVDNKTSQKTLYNFRGLVEKLLKYNRPIIAVSIPTWSSIDLIHGLGINYVSSEVIAQSYENVRPIPPKSLAKIKAMKE